MYDSVKATQIKIRHLSLADRTEFGLHGSKKGDGSRWERLRFCYENCNEKGGVENSERIAIYRPNKNILLIMQGKDENGDDIAISATVMGKENTPAGYKYQIKIGDRETTTIVSEVGLAEFNQHFKLSDEGQRVEIATALEMLGKTDKEIAKIVLAEMKQTRQEKAKEVSKKKTLYQKGVDFFYGPDYKERKAIQDERDKVIKEKHDQVNKIAGEIRSLRIDQKTSKLNNDEYIWQLNAKAEGLLEDIRILHESPIVLESDMASDISSEQIQEAVKQFREKYDLVLKNARIKSDDLLATADSMCRTPNKAGLKTSAGQKTGVIRNDDGGKVI